MIPRTRRTAPEPMATMTAKLVDLAWDWILGKVFGNSCDGSSYYSILSAVTGLVAVFGGWYEFFNGLSGLMRFGLVVFLV
jgi:hypothetical protein